MGRTDLAARSLGGGVVAASDEAFGFKEHLLVPGPSRFVPGRYDLHGEVVDGWETRRRRQGGHDWVLVRLGAPGRVRQVDVDTSSFTGNHPESCTVEGVALDGYPSEEELHGARWRPLVPRRPLQGDSHNLLDVSDTGRVTHLRLSSFPDGGIARLRVWGDVVPDPCDWAGVTVELSSAQHGARVLSSTDDHYSAATALIRPDTAATMGDGWETARRRIGDRDSVVLALATAGTLQRVEVDTTHFVFNASAAFALHGLREAGSGDWVELVPRTRLQPDTRHRFAVETPEVAVVRLDAFPDGGMSRLRLWGKPSAAGLVAAKERFRRAVQVS